MTVAMCRTRGCPNPATDVHTVDGRPVEPGYLDFCCACVRRRRADRNAALDRRPKTSNYQLPGEGPRR